MSNPFRFVHAPDPFTRVRGSFTHRLGMRIVPTGS